MTTILLAFIITILTQLVKGYISPKFGDTGVHVFIFVIGLIVAGVTLGMQNSASFSAIVEQGLGYVALSVSIYEVILKQLGIDNLSTGSTASTLQ